MGHAVYPANRPRKLQIDLFTNMCLQASFLPVSRYANKLVITN